MKKVFLALTVMLLLTSCAHAPKVGCPDVPSIGDQEALKDYTVHLIAMYKECQAIKADSKLEK